MSVAFGVAVFFAIIWFAAHSYASLWRIFSSQYSAWEEPVVAKRLDTIVIVSKNTAGQIISYRQYAGTIISVTPKGLKFSSVAPLNLFSPAFAIPSEEIRVGRTTWAMWPEPYSIRPQSIPESEIIVGHDTLRWIRSHTADAPFAAGE